MMEKKRLNKRGGRPKLEDRVALSDKEKQYAKLRGASGMSIVAAARAVGKRPASMEKAERRWSLLRAEIDRHRSEKAAYSLDESNDLRMKILMDLRGEVSNLLLNGKLTLAEISKSYDLIRSMESDLDSIMQKVKANAPATSDDMVIDDFKGFLTKVAREAAKYIDCPKCNKVIKIPLLSSREKQQGRLTKPTDIDSAP